MENPTSMGKSQHHKFSYRDFNIKMAPNHLEKAWSGMLMDASTSPVLVLLIQNFKLGKENFHF